MIDDDPALDHPDNTEVTHQWSPKLPGETLSEVSAAFIFLTLILYGLFTGFCIFKTNP